MYFLPFFIALLGVFLLHEKITAVMYAGGATIIAGTLMVSVYENELLRLFKKNQTKTGLADTASKN